MAIELSWGPTYTSATDDHGVGNLKYDSSGNVYRWVKVTTADLAKGDVVYPGSVSTWEVHEDYSAALTKMVCGVAVTAVDISDKAYAFVQVGGICDDVLGDGSVAAGNPVIGHSTDGAAQLMAAGEEHLVFGFALEDDSGSPTTFGCQLRGIL